MRAEIRNYVQVLPVAARAMLFGGNLVSLKMIARPHSMVTYALDNLFMYRSITGTNRLHQRNVFEVIPHDDAVDISLASLADLDWWFRAQPSYCADFISLCLLTRLVKPKTVFEIGTFNGHTALHLALNAPDARVYTLDLPPGSTPSLQTTVMDDIHVAHHGSRARRYAFENTPVAGRVHCLVGDSATFDYSPFHGKVDLFFIDGAHSYSYVRSDTHKAMECCRPGSVITWHDFGREGLNGVSKWLKEFSRRNTVYVIPGGSLAYHIVE